MRNEPNGSGLSRKAIFFELEESLRRLQTDYVDLYQIHRWDYETPIHETLEALHDVVKSGKVRYIGASSMYAWQFSKALYLADLHGWTRFVSMQNHYNLLYREEEREMIRPLQRRRHRHHSLESAGARPPGPPLAKKTPGAETDQFGKSFTPKPRRRPRYCRPPRTRSPQHRGVSRAQVALAWMLASRRSPHRSSEPPSRTTWKTPPPRSHCGLPPMRLLLSRSPTCRTPWLGMCNSHLWHRCLHPRAS